MSSDDDAAQPTEAMGVQLVHAGLYLVLEIGQRVSMQQVRHAAPRPRSTRHKAKSPTTPLCAQILVGSWSADLLTSTGHLVRGEVHSDLKRLVLPAKMLQNTLTRRRMAVD